MTPENRFGFHNDFDGDYCRHRKFAGSPIRLFIENDVFYETEFIERSRTVSSTRSSLSISQLPQWNWNTTLAYRTQTMLFSFLYLDDIFCVHLLASSRLYFSIRSTHGQRGGFIRRRCLEEHGELNDGDRFSLFKTSFRRYVFVNRGPRRSSNITML